MPELAVGETHLLKGDDMDFVDHIGFGSFESLRAIRHIQGEKRELT